LEETFANSRATRLLIPQAKSSSIRGWVLLAWVPQVFSASDDKSELLEAKNKCEQKARSGYRLNFKKAWLEGISI